MALTVQRTWAGAVSVTVLITDSMSGRHVSKGDVVAMSAPCRMLTRHLPSCLQVPRTVEVELRGDLVNCAVVGDVVAVLGLVKVRGHRGQPLPHATCRTPPLGTSACWPAAT